MSESGSVTASLTAQTSLCRYVFKNECEFIPHQSLVRSQHRSYPLNYSEHNILSYLLAHKAHPVSKTDLLKAGWPDRVVSEASLFQVIRSLRVKLEESVKGEVIKTVPRVGYQIPEIRIEPIVTQSPQDLKSPPQHEKIGVKAWVTGSLIATGVVGTLLSFAVSRNAESEPQFPFVTHQYLLDASQITVIAGTQPEIEDLIAKLNQLYHDYQQVSGSTLKVRVFAFKDEQAYSVSWCQLSDDRSCLSDTDFSFVIAQNNWDVFHQSALSQLPQKRATPIIQTDMAREPTSQIYIQYVDDSGIDSKVVYQYASQTADASWSYSNMSFISEAVSDYHHVLSISATVLQMTPNQSATLATAQVTPEMYHWAYQSNTIIQEDASMAIQAENALRQHYESHAPMNQFLLYQQPYLDLVFNEYLGIYWVHNSEKNTLFRPTSPLKQRTEAQENSGNHLQQ